jgi:hypothetical protein
MKNHLNMFDSHVIMYTVKTYVLHIHKWIEMGLFYLVYQGFLYCSN